MDNPVGVDDRALVEGDAARPGGRVPVAITIFSALTWHTRPGPSCTSIR